MGISDGDLLASETNPDKDILTNKTISHVIEHVAARYRICNDRTWDLNQIKSLAFSSKVFAEIFRHEVHSLTINGTLYPYEPQSTHSPAQRLANDLSRYKNLQHIRLTGTVPDDMLAALQAVPGLRHLDLTGCKLVSGQSLAHLTKLTTLTQLDLRFSDQVADQELVHLRGLTHLKELKLAGCSRISDSGLVHTEALANLEHLDLMFCYAVTDNGLMHLQKLVNLKELKLTGCTQLTDKGLGYLTEQTRLELLDLELCEHITDQGLEYLKALPNLKYLNLKYCPLITKQGIETLLLNLPALHINQSPREAIPT